MVEEGVSLANLVDVMHVPDVETMVIVDTRQLVAVFIQTHSYSVWEAGCAVLGRQRLTSNTNEHQHRIITATHGTFLWFGCCLMSLSIYWTLTLVHHGLCY